MPNVLILDSDLTQAERLENLLREQGMRVKMTPDRLTAREWLKLQAFDMLLVSENLTDVQLQELCSSLWFYKVTAVAVRYSPEILDVRKHTDARLQGMKLTVGESADTQLKEVVRSIIARQEGTFSHYKVLVVEDLDAPRDIICQYIESLGFSDVQGEASAKSALIALENDPDKFDCIITDIRMPQMSGLELVKLVRVHEKLKHLPIIVLTAYGTPDCLLDSLKVGASGFLVKPPKKHDLLRELNRAMRVSEGQESARLASEQEIDQMREALAERGIS